MYARLQFTARSVVSILGSFVVTGGRRIAQAYAVQLFSRRILLYTPAAQNLRFGQELRQTEEEYAECTIRFGRRDEAEMKRAKMVSCNWAVWFSTSSQHRRFLGKFVTDGGLYQDMNIEQYIYYSQIRTKNYIKGRGDVKGKKHLIKSKVSLVLLFKLLRLILARVVCTRSSALLRHRDVNQVLFSFLFLQGSFDD